MSLSIDEILQLAPDAASAKAARGLALPGKWPVLGATDAALWGECQGSGSKPYQVQVDQSGPAFRCTCPSRKFPCKHGLALMLLRAGNAAAFSDQPPPAWVEEWLAARRQRAENPEPRPAAAGAAGTPADPQAAAKREAARRERMTAGLDELERWLGDQVRQGFARLPAQPAGWGEIAARMVDAQLPGLAWRLRPLESVAGRGENWSARLLARFGQLQFLIDACRRRDELPDPVRADVDAALGLTLDKERVMAGGARLADAWLVLGQSIEQEDRLWVRRAWLLGRQSGRRALLLDYAHGGGRFEPALITGATLRMTLAFYPGAAPLRALIADTPALIPEVQEPPASPLAAALDSLSAALAANPWQWPQPLLISDGAPALAGWRLQTADGRCLPLRLSDEDAWPLVAESGGAPVTVFGEWDGEELRPLACWAGALVWAAGVNEA